MRNMGLLTWFKSLFFGVPESLPGVSPFQPDTGPAHLIILRHAEKRATSGIATFRPLGANAP